MPPTEVIEPQEGEGKGTRDDGPETSAVRSAGGGGSGRRRLLRATVPSLALAGGLGFLNFVRRRFQHQQVFVPDRYPNGIWDPESFGLSVEDVWFESADGTPLHGWWMANPRAKGCVLYCHGNAGNVSNRIGVYRYLLRMGLHIFAFDYRGYGRSDGEPSEAGIYADARAAYDHLTTELDQRPENILIFGHSLGGAVAIDLAVQRQACGLVAQSTFTDVKEMARIRFPSFPLHVVARNQFRSAEKVKGLGLPKLFIHGTADETIPIVLGRKLFEQAAEPKEWFEVPHAGHNDVYRFGGFRYLWKLRRFSSRCLKRKPE